jgi:hypothetical protein
MLACVATILIAAARQWFQVRSGVVLRPVAPENA